MLYNIYNIDECIYLTIAIVLTLIILVICSFHFYKKKKIALNTILSIWSICLSAIAFIAAFLKVDVYFTNDSFVGIMAGFMGACATILVGVQIYNSIDTRNSINKLNESFEKKIKEVESNDHKRIGEIQILNNQLQYDITELNKKIEQDKKEREEKEKMTEYYIDRARAIAFIPTQPFSSYANLHKCLIDALQMKNEKLISNTLTNINTLVLIIEKKINKGEALNCSLIDKVKNLGFETIKEYPSAFLIKKEYTDIHNKIVKIINSLQPNPNNP